METVFIFTDGSYKQNPGPCGAEISISWPEQEFVELKKLVSRLVPIFLGELVAISVALEFIDKETERKQIKEEKFFFFF